MGKKIYVVNFKNWQSSKKGFFLIQPDSKGRWYIQQAFPY
jgi:hypothetical protein